MFINLNDIKKKENDKNMYKNPKQKKYATNKGLLFRK